jgi:hypothetical protein
MDQAEFDELWAALFQRLRPRVWAKREEWVERAIRNENIDCVFDVADACRAALTEMGFTPKPDDSVYIAHGYELFVAHFVSAFNAENMATQQKALVALGFAFVDDDTLVAPSNSVVTLAPAGQFFQLEIAIDGDAVTLIAPRVVLKIRRKGAKP